MVGEIKITEVTYLVIGTAFMLLMMFTIIGFTFIFQRKLSKKAMEYREIEKLLQKQELQSAYFVIEGQEQERKRIAAELHDNIGSLLASLKIYSDLSISKADQQEAKKYNEKVNFISAKLSEEVRKLSHQLDLKTLSGFGLKVAIQQLCEAIDESGKIQVEHFIDMSFPVNEEKAIHIYRIVQELFTNTLKHANASKVRIEITQINEDFTLIFEDNGTGFNINDTKEGMGLQNIRSRISRIHGNLIADSSVNGTTFIVEISNYDE